MLTKIVRRGSMFLLCSVILVSLMVVSAFATEIKLFEDTLSVSDTQNTLAASGDGYKATATGGYRTQVTNTITFTNNTSAKKKLTFSYSVSIETAALGTQGSHTFGDSSGQKEIVLEGGKAVSYSITTAQLNKKTASVTFSSISFEEMVMFLGSPCIKHLPLTSSVIASPCS